MSDHIVDSLEWTLEHARDLKRRIDECDAAGHTGIFEADGRDVATLGAEVERLRAVADQLEKLKAKYWTHYNDGFNCGLQKAIDLIRSAHQP